MHPELAGRAILVSGHHGWFSVGPEAGAGRGDRLIIDQSGGNNGPGWYCEAAVFEPDGRCARPACVPACQAAAADVVQPSEGFRKPRLPMEAP